MDYIFEKGQFTEAELEQAIIELFKEQGYTYVQGDMIHRQFNEILLKEDLKQYLDNRYAAEALSDTEVKKVISNLENMPSTPLYTGNRETYRLVVEGFDLVRDDASQVAAHIEYIDFENPGNNVFKVVNQYTVEDLHERRPDMLMFINGIPVGIFEFKSAIKEDTTIYDAWEQITIRYTRDLPKLMKYCFFAVISDGANTKLGTIFTPYRFFYSWNKANDDETIANGISSLFTMVKGAFAPERILSILRDFVFYPDDSKKDLAIICRYPQFFAAHKMFENIKHHLKPEGDGKGGTYFGATGCGKTYTMLFLARMIALRDNATFRNPTIVLITDREDLDTQASELFVTAKKFLHEDDVRSIESRKDLGETLRDRPSGGVYLTTIQKFCEDIGLLSDRNNIICISDEAHRTQSNTGAKLKKTETGVYTTYGFAEYLRRSFPNATYCGFTGTPIDETYRVFGDAVDQYTMQESCEDGITVRITYEPRLARVIMSDDQAKDIEKYYQECAALGSNPEQIEESKRAMSKMRAILGHPDRLKKLASDIVMHYEALCAEKPEVVQKAMIVCSDRKIAFQVLKNILDLRPEWAEEKKTEDDSKFTQKELDELVPLPKINLVATQGANDEKELFEMCGTKQKHKMLDKQFKDDNSNFKIAVVVDMWITGFDVPSLAVMYIDKPLQRHTLIQTISRVNRVFDGKDKGLVVDYIGFKADMLQAVEMYGKKSDSPIDELGITLSIFRNHLKMIDDLLCNFNATKFFCGEPLERLQCLNNAAEYIQTSNDLQSRFMGLSIRLKKAYGICFPSGELSDVEINKAQFYLAIRSIIYKQTSGDVPDAEVMNRVVEEMVKNAITCTGIEDIVNPDKTVDMFSDEFLSELQTIKMPITKFNALLKLLRKAISDYGRVNKVKSVEFNEMLKAVVEKYNNRDNLVFTSEVLADFVDDLSDELLKILNDLNEDKSSFEKMGISFEEKAFYDILIKVRDQHEFEYSDDKCVELAKKIKELVDDQAQFADWATRSDIKSTLSMELTILLYKNGYPPQWNKEVFAQVMEQAKNFKKYTV